MDLPAYPSLLGIPPELRRKIFENVFATLKHNPFIFNIERYSKKTLAPLIGILGTCKQIRDEALTVLGGNLEIIDAGTFGDGLREFSGIASKMKKIETSRDPQYLATLCRALPQLDTILWTVADEGFPEPNYNLFVELKCLPKVLCGKYDDELMRQILHGKIFDRTSSKKIKLPDAVPHLKSILAAHLPRVPDVRLLHTAKCDLICDEQTTADAYDEFVYEPFPGVRWTAQVSGNNLYRIILNKDNTQIKKREINMGTNLLRKWVPAEDVMFISQFNKPVFYVPKTGESRILSWKHTNDGVPFYDPEETPDLRRGVREQLEDQAVLSEALKSAIKCVAGSLESLEKDDSDAE